MDMKLHNILGYGIEQQGTRRETAKYFPDVYGHLHNLFVYTDIVRTSIVGDSKSNLLRIINYDQTYAIKNITKSSIFNPLLFIPVNKHYIDNISIKIRDYSGNPVQFLSGQVIVILVFKQTDCK